MDPETAWSMTATEYVRLFTYKKKPVLEEEVDANDEIMQISEKFERARLLKNGEK